ncbi:MAG: preprotein translocase subunit SecG [Epulopiscium sp. Nele67-Bin001]|nr:MAG: preprotein translocase subunit SecG [Epulopiscium sp. Nuni2H_MBin001]OON91075.1 MAG: preprotein translocase subunit SecG [Epulopiscium sp. Nele67-Bin001]
MATLRLIITIIFVIAALAIIIIVLMQEGKGSGLSGMTGENSDTFWAQNKKNSLEGRFELFTKLIAAVFIISAALLGMI